MASKYSPDSVESPVVILRRSVGRELSLEDGVKEALSSGRNLSSIGKAMAGLAIHAGFDGKAFGGRGPYATALSESIAITGGYDWFQIRDSAKGHGTQRMVEGSRIDGHDVVVVDALTRTGARLLGTIVDLQEHTGARVVGAMSLVDSEEGARELIAEHLPDTRYIPVYTARQIAPPVKTH